MKKTIIILLLMLLIAIVAIHYGSQAVIDAQSDEEY